MKEETKSDSLEEQKADISFFEETIRTDIEAITMMVVGEINIRAIRLKNKHGRDGIHRYSAQGMLEHLIQKLETLV